MKRFLSLSYKEFLHILRDPLTVLLVLIMPSVLVLLFSYTISVDLRNINVVTVIQHPSVEITSITADMGHNPYFTYLGSANQQTALRMLRSGEADAVITFRSQTASLDNVPEIQLLLDGSNTIKAQNADTYIRGSIMNTIQGSSPKGQHLFATKLMYNPRLESSYQFVPGIMGIIFILICCIMTSCSIVKEKETGSMHLLLVSPANPWLIILAKIVPYIVITIVDLILILFISHNIVGIPIRGSVELVYGISFLYVILSLAVGMLISTVCKTQLDALMTSSLTMLMPLILFSGMVYPIENMPVWLQPVSQIIPATWYISAIRKVMIEGLPFVGVMKETLIMGVMTIVIVGLSVKLFKVKL